jgi:hypothetical protein
MKKLTKKSWMTTALSCFLMISFSQSNPKVPEAWSNTLRMNGSWQGPATLRIGDKTYHLDYHADFNTTADGSGMYMDEWFTDPDLGQLKGANLIGYNPNDQMIHWFSVDNMGTTHDHLGSWKSKDHFYMENQSRQDGKKYIEKIDCKFISDNQFNLEIIGFLDDKVIQELKGNFKRKQKLVSK